MAPMGRFTSDHGPEFEPYYRLIGRLAVDWAEFEFNINEAIWELSNVARMAGTCMTSQMIGPGPRFRCLVALLHLRQTPHKLIDEMNSFSTTADGLGRQRNRYLHDPVVLDEAHRVIHRMEMTADRKLTHLAIPVEADELGNLIRKIEDAGIKFGQIYRQILADTPPWPRSQFEQSEGIRRVLEMIVPDNSGGTPQFPP